MMKSALNAKFAQLGPTRDIDRVLSGSREVIVLTLGPDIASLKSIDAIFAISRRGVATLKAKRAVEAVLEGQSPVLDVPMVEDLKRFVTELKQAGFAVSIMTPRAIDVRGLREKPGLTQEQFALRYGLELEAIRNWEHGRREPDSAAKSYLAVIEREPVRAHEALAERLG